MKYDVWFARHPTKGYLVVNVCEEDMMPVEATKKIKSVHQVLDHMRRQGKEINEIGILPYEFLRNN